MYIREPRVKLRENCVIRAAESELFIKRASHSYSIFILTVRYKIYPTNYFIFFFTHDLIFTKINFAIIQLNSKTIISRSFE